MTGRRASQAPRRSGSPFAGAPSAGGRARARGRGRRASRRDRRPACRDLRASKARTARRGPSGADSSRPARRSARSSTRGGSISPSSTRSRPRRRYEGFRVGALAELRDGIREALHALDAASRPTCPAEFPEDDLRYDEWLAGTFAQPDLDWEAKPRRLRRRPAGRLHAAERRSRGEPGRERHDGHVGRVPGTRPGPAREALGAGGAAEQGIEDVSTGNDARTPAMLAVNRRLGYRRHVDLAWLTKRLG